MAVAPPRGVLVTGATGYLGSFFTLQLLLAGARDVFCLARGNRRAGAAERVVAALEAAARMSGTDVDDVRRRAVELTVIESDLREPGLGISAADMERMTGAGIQQLWHYAAYLKFEEAYRREVLRRNLEGTERIIELAGALRVGELNYVSTFSVAGCKPGLIQEGPYDSAFGVNNPYEESKRRAEDAVIEAAGTGAFHVRVFRPSVVIGHSQTFETTSDVSYYGFVLAVDRYIEWVEGRMPAYFETHPFRIYRAQGATLNMIPVDVAVEHALEVAGRERGPSPELHHLTNPFPCQLDAILPVMAHAFPRVTFELTDDLEDLRALDTIFRDKLAFYNPYLASDKEFECDSQLRRREAQLRFSSEQLIAYTERFLDESRRQRRNSQRKSVRFFDMVEKVTLPDRRGRELTYYRAGSGPPVVVINAYGVSLQAWRDVLSAITTDHRVITWECRGIFEKTDFVFGVGDHAADLEQILDNEEVRSAHVVSWCSGVRIALEAYVNDPARVGSMTFIAGAFAVDRFASPWDKNMVALLSSLQRNPSLAGIYMKTISNLFARGDDDPRDADADGDSDSTALELIAMVSKKHRELVLSPYLTKETILNMANMLLKYGEHDIDGYFERIDVPTLVLAGARDVIVNPDQSRFVADTIADARLVTLPAASHWLIIENPDEVVRELNAFWDHAGGSAS